MDIGKTLYVSNRREWRSWLIKNNRKEKEIWLIYYKKNSGKKRIPYNDAVEEALCFGWIDSTVKKMDDERFAQRFTPRRSKSPISEMNKERVRMMIKKKRMTKFGLDAIAYYFNPEKDLNLGEKIIISKDILKELKANREAWKNFKLFSESYKRIRLSYLEDQRDNDKVFQRSLQYFLRMTEKNKKFGMMR